MMQCVASNFIVINVAIFVFSLYCIPLHCKNCNLGNVDIHCIVIIIILILILIMIMIIIIIIILIIMIIIIIIIIKSIKKWGKTIYRKGLMRQTMSL